MICQFSHSGKTFGTRKTGADYHGSPVSEKLL